MKIPTFQEIILRLETYWAEKGCVIWQPYSEKVGAGTMNPATILKVLGPEAWNVGYVEPSYRPDDGRFAENPNRMQMHTQYQVILKPDPGNPQELYLGSLKAIGIDIQKHDIRFVEDNWASPPLGAWGLGWEVWLDGLEITQFTYFQQAGGLPLDPVAVEITYGLERIAMFLQGVRDVWSLQWNEDLSYGDILKEQEIDHCEYVFNVASIDRLRTLYDLFEKEASLALEHGLAVPALDYLLRCSHTFNLLDTRGAIGVTERAGFFSRMRGLARKTAEAYVAQREKLGFPGKREERKATLEAGGKVKEAKTQEKADCVLEIGSEELPPSDAVSACRQLEKEGKRLFDEARLQYDSLRATGTPRRQVLLVKGLRALQEDLVEEVKGPPASIAYSEKGEPTKALTGFAAKQGVAPEDIIKKDVGKTSYVFAAKREKGKSVLEVLPELLPTLIESLKFTKTMAWDSAGISYPRPIRNFVALWGENEIPFVYAKAKSGRHARGLHHLDAFFEIQRAEEYEQTLSDAGIVLEREERKKRIRELASKEAGKAGGLLQEDEGLLNEVTDLVDAPFALLGSFDEEHLSLPPEVLVAVMKKHQRYFAVKDKNGSLMPHFVVITNGAVSDPELVKRGNEDVIRARYADAAYFIKEDKKKPLEEFIPNLKKLMYQEKLGSMWDKTQRVCSLSEKLCKEVLDGSQVLETVKRAAELSKADLATSMVVEMTSLQGVMGKYYAEASKEKPEIAQAVFEHYLPRSQGDSLPESDAGLVVSLADRLDSLAGLFQADLAPTGSTDPYGLRRSALGLVTILTEKEIDLSLTEGLTWAGQFLNLEIDEGKIEEARDFVIKRLEVQLREDGFRHDVVQSVLAEQGDNPFRAAASVKELTAIVASEDWNETFTAWSRVKRITRPLKKQLPLTAADDTEKETQKLYELFQKTVAKKPGSLREFKKMADALRDQINRFFDIVMVMAEDEKLRSARLSLLQRIAGLPDGLADLTCLEGF